MKVMILGLGAVGAGYGYIFKQAGHDVTHFIRKNKRESTPKELNISLLDGRYNNKGEKKEGIYEVFQYKKSSFDFIFISVSPFLLEQAIDTIRINKIKGTVVLFNMLWYKREELDRIMRGYEYVVFYPLCAGSIKDNNLDFVLFDHVMGQRKEKANIKNYDDLMDLFDSCHIGVENTYDMLEWMWVYMGISSGFITTAGRYYNIKDSENAFFSVVNSSRAISDSFASIRNIMDIISFRGVNLKNYKDILSSYTAPAKIASIVIKNNLKNNEFMRRVLSLDIDLKDILYVCKCVYETGINNNIPCDIFYENYEEMLNKI